MSAGILKLALSWRAIRAKRLKLQKAVTALENQEKALKMQVMDALRKSKNKAVSNGERLFQLETSDEPTVEDWTKLQAHIQKTGEFDLLYRRVNNAAVKERWEVKARVPGVGKIPVDTLSDTKA